MGITLRGSYPGTPAYEMGYITFWHLRKAVAYAADPAFGQLYEELPKVMHTINPKEYEAAMSAHLRAHPLPVRFLDFLYQSDADGRLSPYKCKAVYDRIAGAENKKLYGYAARPETCMTWKQFKALLLECFERKEYLIWN